MSLPIVFGPHRIQNQVFYHTKLSFGLVNLKPIVPGHVLVIPRRVVARFKDLSSEEVSDLFNSVHIISREIEREFNATALTIAIQDGLDAGQSVPHVHAHILPRHSGDFVPNDKIYKILNNTSMDNDLRKPRSKEDMKIEAHHLAKLFNMNVL